MIRSKRLCKGSGEESITCTTQDILECLIYSEIQLHTPRPKVLAKSHVSLTFTVAHAAALLPIMEHKQALALSKKPRSVLAQANAQAPHKDK